MPATPRIRKDGLPDRRYTQGGAAGDNADRQAAYRERREALTARARTVHRVLHDAPEDLVRVAVALHLDRVPSRRAERIQALRQILDEAEAGDLDVGRLGWLREWGRKPDPI